MGFLSVHEMCHTFCYRKLHHMILYEIDVVILFYKHFECSVLLFLPLFKLILANWEQEGIRGKISPSKYNWC